MCVDYIEISIKRFCDLLELRNVEKRTIASYRSYARKFLKFLPDPQNPTLSQAQDFLLKMKADGYSSSTINGMSVAVRRYFAIIHGLDYSETVLPKPIVRHQEQNSLFFTSEQAVTLINSCKDSQLQAAMALGFDCGLRSSEVVNIKFSDIDKQKHTILLPHSKRNRSRIVKYSPATKKIINNYYEVYELRKMKDNPWLFPGKKPGEPMKPHILTKRFHSFIQAFDFTLPKHRFHCLRHAHATALVKLRASPFAIQKEMGHSSIATTMRYVHLDDQDILDLPSPLDDREDSDDHEPKK